MTKPDYEEIAYPVKEYASHLKEEHARNTSVFFEDLVRKSGVDAEANASLVKTIRKKEKLLAALKSRLGIWRFLRNLLVLNALAAAAVGRYFGVADADIVDGLATMKALGGRVNILETPFGTVIDDCYNASPASMKAALELLASAEGPKTAILGDMGELGTTEKELHREVGAFAGKLGIDRFLLAGTLAGEIAEGIKESCPDAEIVHLPNTEALLADLITVLPKGGNVLVKASHFMGFERIVKLLEG
ncbi:MAG: glutamate ligase domain-containing protein [bacterium]